MKWYKSCRFVQEVLLKVSGQRFYMNALLSAPLLCVFLCVVVPLGLAVRPHDIFIRRATMTPQPDGKVSARWALTLSLAILSQKSCQGEVCSQAVLLQPPDSQPSAPDHSGRLGQIYFRSQSPLQSQDTLFFYDFLLLTLVAGLHLQHNLVLIGQLCWASTAVFRALRLLLMCIYWAERASPELFAILSASGTVSFVSSNVIERDRGLLTMFRGKGGSSEPMRVDDLCLSAAIQTYCSFVLGWSRS